MKEIILQRIPSPLPFQTPGEEAANSIIHGLGVLLSVTALVLLVLRAGGRIGGSGNGNGTLAAVTYVIYTASLIASFLTSTLYHAITHDGAKRVFRVLDHSAIYLLIAGTYTPICLLHLRGGWGWTFFGIEWALTAAGISLYAANWKFYKKAELVVYILMGWVIAIGWFQLIKAISVPSAIFLMAGGLAYMLGVYWYKRPTRRGAHVVWHVFVLAGAVSQWWSLWLMS
ncbi:hemolysin III [Spirochaetia bacterium]|nr:hemolysin III [Spirochaetia bacterium]